MQAIGNATATALPQHRPRGAFAKCGFKLDVANCLDRLAGSEADKTLYTLLISCLVDILKAEWKGVWLLCGIRGR